MNLTEKHCWAEISLDNVKNNYNFIKNSFNRPFYVVLKADAYGHGAKYLAKVYEELGAFGIAVSCFAEAMEIRNSGVKLPVLILGYTDPKLAVQLSKNQISQCVFSLEYAKQLDMHSLYPIDCHLKLDTGMGRIGFDMTGDKEAALEEAKQLLSLPNLRFTGVFTHFSSADDLSQEAIEHTENQIKLFDEAVETLTRYGFNFKIIHGQNSAGILRKLGDKFNVMRAGIILYGCNPSAALAGTNIKPCMQVKTVVTHVKEVKAGQKVGYGMVFCPQTDRKIATVAIGYADGLPRILKNKDYHMVINGVKMPLAAVCMDQCMLDVTGYDVKVGDEVIAMGGKGETSFDNIAQQINTINYEVMCAIQRRVPRVYTQKGKVVHIETNM